MRSKFHLPGMGRLLARLAALALALLVAMPLPVVAAADPGVEEMVNALSRKPAADVPGGGVRMRSLGTKKPVTAAGQLQLSVQFEFASATIAADSRSLLARLGEAMNSPALAGRRFRIEGHTDASGDAAGNLRLSERRAQSVRQFLGATAGVDAARLAAVGKGSSEPVDGSDPRAAVNRRVVVVALAETAAATAVPVPVVDAAPAGTVSRIQGDVTLVRNRDSTALRHAAAVHEGDTITTAVGASVLVDLADGARLLVRAGTTVQLSRIANRGALDQLAHAIDLTLGAIRYVTGAVGRSRPDAVRFKTPTATIGIRGTDIEIVHAPKLRSLQGSGTYVRVNRGEIELGGNDGSRVTLMVNEQAFAGAPGPKMRGGERAPAARKLDAPAAVFVSGDLDGQLDRPLPAAK